MKKRKGAGLGMLAGKQPKIEDSLHHGLFIKQGTMVAYPLCFPGQTIQITADESRITALDTDDNGFVYGGTSGYAAHGFVAMFKGVTGFVFDFDRFPDFRSCPAICCGKDDVIIALNDEREGHLTKRPLQRYPFDMIQEWSFQKQLFEDLGPVSNGESIRHMARDAKRETIVGITESQIFRLSFTENKIEIVGSVPGNGKVVFDGNDCFWGQDGDSRLWCYCVSTDSLTREVFKLPAGKWPADGMLWARHWTEPLYTFNDVGELFSFQPDSGFSSKPLAKVELLPVRTAAVTNDGRLFGFSGDGMAHLFCYDPASQSLSDFGVSVSVIERRRYGYCFADAVTGKDGQIYFAEDDDLGHLWIYFPSIPAQGGK